MPVSDRQWFSETVACGPFVAGAGSFERISKAAGLRPIRLHDLRHTTATLLNTLGVPPRDAMEILGHSRIAVTLEVYTAGDERSRREAIGKLSDLFGSQAG
jgi:integrase